MEIRHPPAQLQPRDLSTLFLDLYASVTNQTGLGGFLARICTILGANLASISLADHESGRWRHVESFPADAASIKVYETHYAQGDPVKGELLRQPPNRFYTAAELGSKIVPEAYTIWNRRKRKAGYGDLCVTHFHLDEHYTCMIGFARKHADPAFTRDDISMLDLLMSHIVQVLSIHARIDRLRILADIAQEQFAQLGAGCVTLNADGRVNFINSVARDLLRSANGIHLRDGMLHLSDESANARLHQLQKTCITVSRLPTVMGGNVLAAPRANALPLNIVVLSYRNEQAPRAAIIQASHAIVLIFDPARPHAAPSTILRELYAFSECEATVCWRLANGESLDEIAAAEGVSKETVRSQLKRIFMKTGTKRQTELVRLVLTGPATIGGLPGN